MNPPTTDQMTHFTSGFAMSEIEDLRLDNENLKKEGMSEIEKKFIFNENSTEAVESISEKEIAVNTSISEGEWSPLMSDDSPIESGVGYIDESEWSELLRHDRIFSDYCIPDDESPKYRITESQWSYLIAKECRYERFKVLQIDEEWVCALSDEYQIESTISENQWAMLLSSEWTEYPVTTYIVDKSSEGIVDQRVGGSENGRKKTGDFIGQPRIDDMEWTKLIQLEYERISMGLICEHEWSKLLLGEIESVEHSLRCLEKFIASITNEHKRIIVTMDDDSKKVTLRELEKTYEDVFHKIWKEKRFEMRRQWYRRLMSIRQVDLSYLGQKTSGLDFINSKHKAQIYSSKRKSQFR